MTYRADRHTEAGLRDVARDAQPCAFPEVCPNPDCEGHPTARDRLRAVVDVTGNFYVVRSEELRDRLHAAIDDCETVGWDDARTTDLRPEAVHAAIDLALGGVEP
jgi:hypothetical protein